MIGYLHDNNALKVQYYIQTLYIVLKQYILMQSDFCNELLEQVAETTYNNFKQQRQEERLDPKELKAFKQKYIKPLYPYALEPDGSKRKYKICQACGENPGSFYCCGSSPPNESYIRYGLAICVYLKFLKHINVVYVFLSILAISACVVCYAVALQNNFSPSDSYTTFFFSTSYGTFSSQYNKCQYALIDSTTHRASLSMSCPYGFVNASVTQSTLPAVLTSQSLNSLYNCRNQRKKLQSGSDLAKPYLSILSATSVTFSNSNSRANITLTFNGSQPYKLVSFVYECYDNTYNIGVISTKSDNFFYYVVSVDLAICCIFLIFFYSEFKAEEKEIQFFKQNQVSLDDFSIQIRGLHRNTLEKQLQELFQYFSDKCPEFRHSLLAITIPEVQEEVQQRQYRRSLYRQFYDLINDYYFRDNDQLPQFNDCHAEVSKEQNYAEFKEKLIKCTQQILSLKRRDVSKDSVEEIEVYLVFDNIIAKQQVMALQSEKCCSVELKHFDQSGAQRDYSLKTPPVPDTINWQNRYKWTKIRSFLSWILTLIICIGSYLLFGFIQYKQSQLNSDYNYSIDCTVLFPNENLTIYNVALSTSNEYVTCYCKDQSLLNVASSQQNYCQTWQKQYILYKTIPLLISLGIVIVNVLVGQIFKGLTYLEKQQYGYNQQLSYALKRGFLLMMNLGLIMILLNINYQNSVQLQQVSFIFLGKFDSFTSDWYYQIGAIIILTMIFNIAFSLIELLFACIIKCLKKCLDTRCCTRATSRLTKQQYIDLYSDEEYPIGERYAYLMASFIISMAFSGIMPILIPIAFISFFLLYHADSILLFKYYQRPAQYGQTLHKSFRIVFFISLMLHFGLTAYFLAEPTLIAKGATINSTSYEVNTSSSRFNNMLRTSYILPYIGLFLLMLGYAIFGKFILGALVALREKCCPQRDANYKSAVVQRLNLLGILSMDQRRVLEASLEIELAKLLVKKKEKSKKQINFMVSGVDYSESQQPQIGFLIQQEDIIQSSLSKLKATNSLMISQPGHLKLLGLSSYEEYVKSKSLSRDEEIVRFEGKLRALINKIHKESKAQLSKKSSPDNLNNQTDVALITNPDA